VIISLRLEKLSLVRGARVLFSELSAHVAAGEILSVTGPNGAGKTSLLRAVAGLLLPAEGRIVFEGAYEASEVRRAHIHFVGHQDGLKSGRSAREELVFQARWCGGATPAAIAAADRLGLSRQLDLEVRRLSAGQRRRLALARLIAAPRPLWLLDEPLAPLDTANRALMGEIMAEHLGSGGLILAAVHDPLPVRSQSLELAS
jgi:heme exporter protein A